MAILLADLFNSPVIVLHADTTGQKYVLFTRADCIGRRLASMSAEILSCEIQPPELIGNSGLYQAAKQFR